MMQACFGWCATKIDENYEPSKYAYCNANGSIQERQIKEAKLRQQRKDFIQNNKRIIKILMLLLKIQLKKQNKNVKPKMVMNFMIKI